MLTQNENCGEIQRMLVHERGFRSGTLPVHQLVAMGEASLIAQKESSEENLRIHDLKMRLWHGIKDIEVIVLNKDLERNVSGICV